MFNLQMCLAAGPAAQHLPPTRKRHHPIGVTRGEGNTGVHACLHVCVFRGKIDFPISTAHQSQYKSTRVPTSFFFSFLPVVHTRTQHGQKEDEINFAYAVFLCVSLSHSLYLALALSLLC